MFEQTDIVRIKCGEIYILSTDYFSLSCEFCKHDFNTLEKLHVHLNEHFKQSPNIKNENSKSCDSEPEIPDNIQENDVSSFHSADENSSESPAVSVDIKYSLADNLQNNDVSNSTVADETFIEDKSEQSEESLRRSQPRWKHKLKPLSEIQNGNIANPGMQEGSNSKTTHNMQLRKTVRKFISFEVNLKVENRTDSSTDYSDETKDTESSSIRKELVDSTDPAQRIKSDFECSFCSKVFKSRVNRSDHENSHTGKRPYQCRICTKSFTTQPNLYTHVNLHADYRSFQCSECDKKFVNQAKLNFHIRENHLPDTDPRRYFQCKQCGYKLKSYGLLHRHRQTHKDNHSIFTCDYCRKQFSTKGILVQHMRIHSGIKPYKCAYCHTTFRQLSNKIQHGTRCIFNICK